MNVNYDLTPPLSYFCLQFYFIATRASTFCHINNYKVYYIHTYSGFLITFVVYTYVKMSNKKNNTEILYMYIRHCARVIYNKSHIISLSRPCNERSI